MISNTNTKLLLFALFTVLLFGFLRYKTFVVGEKSNNPSQLTELCNRTVQHENDPELNRALNLYFQRVSEKTPSNGLDSQVESKYAFLLKLRNCLKIVYVDSEDSLAYFLTNENIPNTINVYFSRTRKSENDIENSILLAHELDHVAEILMDKSDSKNMKSCIDLETSAEFASYYYFSTKLNNGEFIAMANYPEHLSEIVNTVRDIGRLTLNNNINFSNNCKNNDVVCYDEGIKKLVKNMLLTDPKYSGVCSKQ